MVIVRIRLFQRCLIHFWRQSGMESIRNASLSRKYQRINVASISQRTWRDTQPVGAEGRVTFKGNKMVADFLFFKTITIC